MKTSSIWRLILILIGLVVSVTDAKENIVVLQVNESSPYWSQSLSSGGMGSEIIKAISQEMGLKTRIEFVPLKRLIANTSNNDVGNPLFYMFHQDFAAIIPIGVMYSAFFTYRNDAKSMAMHMNLDHSRIGALRGTIKNLSNIVHIGQFEESNSKESLFKKLKAGRIDMAMELNLVGRETIEKLFPLEAEHFDSYVIPESAAPIAIMLDSECPDGVLVGKRYQEGLHRIMKKGIYQKILEKYYGQTIPAQYYRDLSQFETLYGSDSGDGSL